MKNIQVVLVDCQNDFCDPKGALYVKDGEKYCERLAAMIDKHGDKIDDIRLTYDSHTPLHLAHKICWRDTNGNNPAPFTVISKDDVISGKWRASNPAWQKRYLTYITELSQKGFVHVIWPDHCLISTWGWGLYPTLIDAVNNWERKYFAMADYVTKGSNIFTEAFGVVAAEVPDSSDPSTQINTTFIKKLEQADVILVGGVASSHCVKRSVEQIVTEFGEQHAKKLVLLTDGMGPVPGFESAEETFFKYAKSIGMQFSTTTTFFK